MYLMIENKNECPIQGFTVLGVGTSRDEEGKIGQFQTGAKLSIVLLIRKQLTPIIYSGETKLTFETIEEMMGHKLFNRVCYRENDGPIQKLGWSTEYGDLDWNDVGMALREFISNALDQDEDVCTFKVVDTPEPKAGYTRVFIPMCQEVRDYIHNIEKYFLHFTYQHKLTYIPCHEDRGPRIYRRGVLVRELSKDGHKAKFDYNFYDMSIDECRNLNDSDARYQIGSLITTDKDLWTAIMKDIIQGRDIWEYHNLSRWDFSYNPSWKTWWKESFGDLLIAGHKIELEYAMRKGLPCVMVNEWIYHRLHENGIPAVDFQPLDIEKKGCVITEAEKDDNVTFNKLWAKMVRLDLTKGFKKPKMQVFELNSEGGAKLLGQYRDGVIYIEKNNVHNVEVLLEEICHHITGASDFTRDFQNYLLRVAARFANIKT